MAFDSARIPGNLQDAYREGRCALLVGAGASMGAGLPSWKDLLDTMTGEALEHGVVAQSKADEYRKLTGDPSKFLMVASGLKEDFAAYFDDFIERTFVGSEPQPTGLHDAIVKAANLKFVITTNYDMLIEQAYRMSGKVNVPVCSFRDTGEIQRRLYKREFFILKAHGDAAKAGNGIILTEVDYREILYRQRAYQSLLSAMFTMFTIIFVGASMSDPEVKLLLNYIADSFGPNHGPSHFALMAEEDITAVEKDRWFKDSKVQLIPISKADDYSELTEFMTALHATAAE